MSAITPVLTSIAGDLVLEILVIVGGVAVLVGIGILVDYGFKKLRTVADNRDFENETGDYAPGEIYGRSR